MIKRAPIKAGVKPNLFTPVQRRILRKMRAKDCINWFLQEREFQFTAAKKQAVELQRKGLTFQQAWKYLLVKYKFGEETELDIILSNPHAKATQSIPILEHFAADEPDENEREARVEMARRTLSRAEKFRRPEKFAPRYISTMQRFASNPKARINSYVREWFRLNLRWVASEVGLLPANSDPDVLAKKYLSIGAKFLHTFNHGTPNRLEARVSIRSIQDTHTAPLSLELFSPQLGRPIGFMGVYFLEENKKKIIAIHSIQTDEHYLKLSRRPLERIWAQLLFTEIEKHAIKNGFSELRILRPEHLRELQDLKPEEMLKISSFYYTLANRFHVRKNKGIYRGKDLPTAGNAKL